MTRKYYKYKMKYLKVKEPNNINTINTISDTSLKTPKLDST